jgi:SNF2 family DNA or RNA helicase
MRHVDLDIDEIARTYILNDVELVVATNRRLKFYLLTELHAMVDKDGRYIIPYNLQERDELLRSLYDALDKYGVDVVNSSAIITIHDDYLAEKERFAEFSVKAKNIWNNLVDTDDFATFEKAVFESFPERCLYDKQLLAAFHLAYAQNACNFSVPGAGKTSIVYGAYAFLRSLPSDHKKYVNKLVIIGPLSSFAPWEDEYSACFGVKAHAKRLSGSITAEERNKYLYSVAPASSIPELTLMSYQSVPNSIDGLRVFLNRRDIRVMLVLDEAHKIKNVDGGVWANSVLELAELSSVASRVVLTGTPIPNGYEDIYNLFEFIWPKKDVIRFLPSHLREMSKRPQDPRVEQLIEQTAPFFIRIKKSDVLDSETYPIEDIEPIRVGMSPLQKQIYDEIADAYVGHLADYDDSNQSLNLLTKARYIRLMQAASNPSLLLKPIEKYFQVDGLKDELVIHDRMLINNIADYSSKGEIPKKFEAVGKLVQTLYSQGEKVVVWCTFIDNMYLLQRHLASLSIESELLYGDVPTESDNLPDNSVTREKIIKAFHKQPASFSVLIANPSAVSESISLHKACHKAIYLEKTFDAARFIQSKDRIHRVGLPKGTVTSYFHFLSAGTIDETIHRRLLLKEKRMIEIIESQEIPLFIENLGEEIDMHNDIKAIISDYVRRSK